MIARLKAAFVAVAIALSLMAGTLPASANITWESSQPSEDGSGGSETQNVTWE